MIATLLLAATLRYGTSITGDYFRGDGLGVNWSLTLTANHQFTFVWRGCLGIYGEASGDWSEDAQILTLKPSWAADGGKGLPLRYHIVPWGARTYLVAEDELPQFCAYVNSGWEPRNNVHGLFFLKDGDETIAVGGRPELPAGYESLLVDAPIRALIREAKGKRGMIDKGSADGIRVNMVLGDQDDLATELHVVSVSAHSAVVECSCDELAAGHRLSTSIYDEAWKP